MLKNYLFTTLRALRRHQGYTAINVLGLAVGLACCLLIGLFVRDEFAYDRFHADADRLVFVGVERSFGGTVNPSMATPLPLARALEQEIPGIEAAVTTTWSGSQARVVRAGTDLVGQRGVLYADSTFFDLFSFPLLRGDAATALDAPNQVVITEAMAEAFFGDADPIGQTLGIERSDSVRVYTVTGILAPPSDHSYFDFEAVASLNTLGPGRGEQEWSMSSYTTFARLAPGVSAEVAEAALPDLVRTHGGEDADTRYFFVPMTDLYLSDLTADAGFRGSTRYLFIFGSIALFVLLVAIINYMNLATARAGQRLREVGVRKTVGATRGHIARQFLVEAVLVTAAAFVLGVVMAALALPLFNGIFEKDLSLLAALTPGGVLVALGAVLLIGVLAGSYPALYLSGFRPIRLLRGETGGRGGAARLRKGLVVTQFAVTVVLLVATVVVYRQLQYLRAQDLGFADDQVLAVDFDGDVMEDQPEAVKQAILAHPGVLSASAASDRPGSYGVQYGFHPDPNDPDREMAAYLVRADEDYAATLGLEIVAGRGFDPERPTDRTAAFLINEAAATELGWDQPLGHAVPELAPEDNQVIGIVRDYHFASLREPIEPAMIRVFEPDFPWTQYQQLLIRVRPEATADVLAHVRAVWDRFGAEATPEPIFLDEAFAEMYATDQRLGLVFGVFAVVAVLIACLGLLGLAAFAAEQRRKEIGIRKVLGASVTNLVALLSKDFLVLVGVAFVIAAPLAYLVMDRWLEDFAYRIHLGVGTLVLAGLGALVIALLTVAGQAFRAAAADPVQSLRYE